jgi:hypothetical protein
MGLNKESQSLSKRLAFFIIGMATEKGFFVKN